MRHRTIKPKKGIRPTRIVELCPNCDGPLTLFPDPATETTTKVCRVCKYMRTDGIIEQVFFRKGSEFKQ